MAERTVPDPTSVAQSVAAGQAMEETRSADYPPAQATGELPDDHLPDPTSVAQSVAAGQAAAHQQQSGDAAPDLIGETLEADSYGDRDSALGDEDFRSSASSFTSVTSANFHHAYGKRYHAYSDAHYILPNNEQEMDRLELQHRIWDVMLSGRLHLAPIRQDISHAIDLGCGTGAWAIDFADSHPDCDVVGLDLSPIQPDVVPPNLSFIVDDATKVWAFGTPFDYVHTRAIASGIRDWPSLVEQAFQNLKPGGWLEMQEFHLPFMCDDGSLPPDSTLAKFTVEQFEAIEKTGVRIGRQTMQVDLPKIITDAGFIHLDTAHSKWPIGPWAKGQKEKLIGALFLRDVEGNMENLTKRIMMGLLGYTEEQVETTMEAVLRDVRDSSIHMHMPMCVTLACSLTSRDAKANPSQKHPLGPETISVIHHPNHSDPRAKRQRQLAS